MPNVLLPVDGSDNSTRAVDAACRQVAHCQPVTVHLLNVQPPNHSEVVAKYLSQDLIDKFHQEEGETALQSARARLDEADIAYTAHVEIGDVAQTIARYVRELGCDQVILVESESVANDRRVRHIRLSRKGRELVRHAKQAVWPVIEAAVAQACEPLKGSLLDQLAALEAALELAPLHKRVADTTAAPPALARRRPAR